MHFGGQELPSIDLLHNSWLTNTSNVVLLLKRKILHCRWILGTRTAGQVFIIVVFCKILEYF